MLADVVRIPFKTFENKAEIVDLSIGVPYFFFLRFFSICCDALTEISTENISVSQ